MELYQYCIGDIVRYYEDLYRVYGFNKGDNEITLERIEGDKRSSLISVYIGYISPVVIDENILESFGITKHYGGDSYCYRDYAHNESVRFTYIKACSKWEIRHYEALYFTKLSSSDYVCVKYLHQLQQVIRILGLKDLVYIR